MLAPPCVSYSYSSADRAVGWTCGLAQHIQVTNLWCWLVSLSRSHRRAKTPWKCEKGEEKNWEHADTFKASTFVQTTFANADEAKFLVGWKIIWYDSKLQKLRLPGAGKHSDSLVHTRKSLLHFSVCFDIYLVNSETNGVFDTNRHRFLNDHELLPGLIWINVT